MGMEMWAEREIELACKKENPNWEPNCDTWDYGCACYQSALKAYKSLLGDEHSGFSWSMTKFILERLMSNLPLTSITDEDFVVNKDTILQTEEALKDQGIKSSVQCPRMSSLFKEETLDGKIVYIDINRYYCFESDDDSNTYQGGGACQLLDEMFPITMPYYPQKEKYKVCKDTFLLDKKHGDWDCWAFLYIITPDGTRVDVNKFYRDVDDGEPTIKSVDIAHVDENGKEIVETHTYTTYPTKVVEITKEEFYELKKNRIDNENTNK